MIKKRNSGLLPLLRKFLTYNPGQQNKLIPGSVHANLEESENSQRVCKIKESAHACYACACYDITTKICNDNTMHR